MCRKSKKIEEGEQAAKQGCWKTILEWLQGNKTNENGKNRKKAKLGSNEFKETPKFQSLAPTENAERIEIYKEALKQALDNKDVYNIAVAGAYGAGKSSFLRTYFKDDLHAKWFKRRKQHKVITISLAELASKQDIQKGATPAKDITKQEIEVSILHQLFFHERAGALTDSHFTKIQKIGCWKLFRYTGYALLYLVSCVHLIRPRLLTTIFELGKLPIAAYREWWHWISVVFFVVGSIFIISRLIRIAAQIAVRKFSVDAASIEIANKKEKSILNAHIDEIIYIFSEMKYDVVLIEDLDRFKLPSIFVKLREINSLINNSQEVKQQVRFIYAISDGMFTDTTRTKFFDFIIPIIPMVDASNAGEFLRKFVPAHLGNLVDALAVYLNDARLLSNIANEFYIYENQQTKQNPKGDAQILALVVYKNLYPSDFEDLRTQRKGILAHALSQRTTLLTDLTAEKDKEIENIQVQITQAAKERIQNKKELRQLMMAAVLHEALNATTNNYLYRQIRIGNQTFAISELVKDDIFELFKNAQSYDLQSVGYYNNRQSGTPYSQLAPTVYGSISYEDRLRQIEIQADDSQLQERVKKLSEEKTQLKGQTIQQLLQSKALQIKWGTYETEETKRQRSFIYDMLYGGYITENYADYISFFHEGSLSSEDYLFIRSVRIKEKLASDTKLHNTKKIVEKLELGNFEQEEILNFDLVDTLVSDYLGSEKCSNVIKLLKKYSSTSIDFLAKYVVAGKHSDVLITELCKDEKKLLWSTINKSSLSAEAKTLIAQSIIRYGAEQDVVNNFKDSTDYLSSKSDYFTWAIEDGRLKGVALALDLKFETLDDGTAIDDLRFVYENNLYTISYTMLKRVVPIEHMIGEYFENANFSFINSPELVTMLAYINENIVQYVDNVLLRMSTQMMDEPQYVSLLLANEKLTTSQKEAIIKLEITEWKSVDTYETFPKEVQLMLYKHNRVAVTWENVLYLFGLDVQALYEYIQQEEVLRTLRAIGKPDFGEEVREKWQVMQNALVANPNLEAAVEQLIDCFDVAFDQMTISKCSEKLLRRLIEKGLIVRGLPEYKVLHDANPAMALEFFVKYYENYDAVIPDLEFDEYDIEQLFRDDYNLSIEQKLYILGNIDAEKSITMNSSDVLVKFLMQQDVKADKENEGIFGVIEVLLYLKNLPTTTRITLFNKYPIYEGEDNDELNYMISTFDAAYIETDQLKHQIPYSREAYEFGRYLMKIGYVRNCVKFVKKGIISITKK